MKEYYNEYLDIFLTELKEESLRVLRKENVAYSELCSVYSNASEKIKELLRCSPEKVIEFTESLKEDINEMQSIQTDWVYLQGYKDCMKFLKIINAFG